MDDNKNIFASNLKYYMSLKQKSRMDISEALGISYYTVTDWVNGKKYPRMDKVERLANFFGILKSDLIEEFDASKKTPSAQIITKGEQKLLDLFRRVPENQQQMVLQMIEVALKTIE